VCIIPTIKFYTFSLKQTVGLYFPRSQISSLTLTSPLPPPPLIHCPLFESATPQIHDDLFAIPPPLLNGFLLFRFLTLFFSLFLNHSHRPLVGMITLSALPTSTSCFIFFLLCLFALSQTSSEDLGTLLPPSSSCLGPQTTGIPRLPMTPQPFLGSCAKLIRPRYPFRGGSISHSIPKLFHVSFFEGPAISRTFFRSPIDPVLGCSFCSSAASRTGATFPPPFPPPPPPYRGSVFTALFYLSFNIRISPILPQCPFFP